MRILLASAGGIGCWFLLRLQREGHECDWFEVEPEPRHQYVLKGLIPPPLKDKPKFKPYDLVIFDCTGNAELAEEAAKVSPVIGDSELASKLEDDRQFGIEVMEECGIEVPPYQTFENPEEAKSFIAENPKRYVYKPFVVDGEEQECDTTYVSDSAEDLTRSIDALFEDSKGAPFLLQEVVEGTEISTEGYFDGARFHFLNHTLEEKKFMSGCYGPNTGCSGNLVWVPEHDNRLMGEIKKLTPFLKEAGYRGMIDLNAIVNESHAYGLEFCYSEDTEVLTEAGWRPMRDVRPGDIVAGMDDDKNLIYVPVEETTRLRWNQPIMHIKSGNCYDLMVTPNHNMCLLDKKGNLVSKPACKISTHGERTIRTAKWTGLDVPTYTIPEHVEHHALGRYKKVMDIPHPSITVPMEAWCRFLGIFIAEGNLHYCGHETPYQVQVTQYVKVAECRKIIEDCGFKYTYDGHHLTINSMQLATHLCTLIGHEKSYGKRMPRFILDLAPQYIEAFLDGHRIGDGSIHKRSGQRTFHSSSKGLADDIGECLLRIGSWCRITKTIPNGKSYAVRDMYHVNERKVKMDGRIFPQRHCKYVPYDGHTVCLTVPYHRLYVRRPGGPAMWCANTPRFGYDASATIFSLIDGDLGKFFLDIADAPEDGYIETNPVPPLRGRWAASERLTMPPYPQEQGDFTDGLPIRGIDIESAYRNCYLWDAMMDKRRSGEDGLVTVGINGIVACPIASAYTPEGAWKGLERISKPIKFPNLQCRDDLEESTLKRLKEVEVMGWLK